MSNILTRFDDKVISIHDNHIPNLIGISFPVALALISGCYLGKGTLRFSHLARHCGDCH